MKVNPKIEIDDSDLAGIWQWHHHVSDDKSNEDACVEKCRECLQAIVQRAFNQGREYQRNVGDD
jgi:hypothetical protein